MKSLEKSLNEYIKEKHTQEECSGFIDGYNKAYSDIRFIPLIISRLRNLLIVSGINWH